jgi:hypothetical protein
MSIALIVTRPGRPITPPRMDANRRGRRLKQVKLTWIFRSTVNGSPSFAFRKAISRPSMCKKFDDQDNATRAKIAEVARRLGAVIATDAGGDLLSY